MSNPVMYFEVLGKDCETLSSFYAALFGWQMKPGEQPDYLTVSTGEGIGGGIGPAMDGGAGHAIFYVKVTDIAESISLAESRGGRRVSGPDEIPGGGVTALVADPEGHLFGLYQLGNAANPEQIP